MFERRDARANEIMDARERLQGYVKANLTLITFDKQSLMPAYGPDRVNDRDLDDLLRYLTSLRGATEATR